jgi:hypothetical protein
MAKRKMFAVSEIHKAIREMRDAELKWCREERKTFKESGLSVAHMNGYEAGVDAMARIAIKAISQMEGE